MPPGSHKDHRNADGDGSLRDVKYRAHRGASDMRSVKTCSKATVLLAAPFTLRCDHFKPSVTPV